ncbi:PIN domain-containing protein [Acidobacteria bacterium AH-259-O06]|nr:PIN domain-containing protein [Acidobacteria bacterium AH-259-O06]
MIVYLDTSTVLRVLFGQAGALNRWGKWEAAYSSELLGLEARRMIDRLRLQLALDDEGLAEAQEGLALIEEEIGYISLTRPVLQRAALPLGTVVKTLDAIHLASALLFQERRGGKLIFATHDKQQAVAAKALGFEVIGV